MMRNYGLVIGLVALAFATTGTSECDPRRGHETEKSPAACGEHCKVDVHFNEKCAPVDADGNSMEKVHINPNTWVCLINDAGCTVRLTFTKSPFSTGETEVTLENGKCIRLQIDRQAARKKFPYTIACDCPNVPGGGSGNPEFNVGGGGGGGGG